VLSAILTVGDAHDLKHFLPRILELAALTPSWWVDPELALRRLRYAEWATWPPDERTAVDAFLNTWWESVLSTLPPDTPPFGSLGEHATSAEACLCAIGQVVDDLSPYLAEWRIRSDTAAVRHLAHLVLDTVDHRRATLLVKNPYWKDRPEQAEQVNAWLSDPATAAQLEHSFFDCIDDEAVQEELSASLKWLA
jgi:hypothetical protein